MKTNKQEQINALKEIKRIVGKCANKRVYADVVHVSASGMSRNIKFAAITKKGDYRPLTWYIAKALGYNLQQDGTIKVYGCGMDMIFNTLYNLNSIAKSLNIVRVSKNKDEHELRYNGIVNTNYYRL